MRSVLITISCSSVALLTGLVCGVYLSPQLRQSAAAQWIANLSLKSSTSDGNSPFDMYDYPTIKWKAKPVADAPDGAIVQLWTRYEKPDDTGQGKMNYKLVLFKVPDKSRIEVQLLDDLGFKLTQFDASDFHKIPGAPDVMEARDSHSCSEEIYRRVRDYSIK